MLTLLVGTKLWIRKANDRQFKPDGYQNWTLYTTKKPVPVPADVMHSYRAGGTRGLAGCVPVVIFRYAGYVIQVDQEVVEAASMCDSGWERGPGAH